MSDFREAFAQGQTAWKDAERVRTEVDQLLERLATEVHEASGRRVVILHGRRSDLRGYRVGELIPERLAVSPASAQGREEKEICRYELAEGGFPVTLRYFRTEARFHDLVALEEGLKQMLASPMVGREIAQAMDASKAA